MNIKLQWFAVAFMTFALTIGGNFLFYSSPVKADSNQTSLVKTEMDHYIIRYHDPSTNVVCYKYNNTTAFSCVSMSK